MSLKEAAEQLNKIADELEVQADEVTKFVCDECNHTASLATINAKRKTAAEEAGENVVVERVTVNDVLSCPACDSGTMSYQASEESDAYYISPKTADDDEDDDDDDKKEEEEKEEKSASEPINYDALDRYQNA